MRERLFRFIVPRWLRWFGISNMELFHMFGMSIPSAERWRAGRGVPHPVMHRWVYRKLLKRAIYGR